MNQAFILACCEITDRICICSWDGVISGGFRHVQYDAYTDDAPNDPEDLEGVNPVFRPLLELEDLIVGSRYINVLAVYPEHRGKGIGSRLLTQAEALSRGRRMSLIVSDSNHGAIRLYERYGYSEFASRPKAKGDWNGPGDRWILMVK